MPLSWQFLVRLVPNTTENNHIRYLGSDEVLVLRSSQCRLVTPSPMMVEAGGSCDQVLDLPLVQNKFKSNLGNLMRHCLSIKCEKKGRDLAQCLCGGHKALGSTSAGKQQKLSWNISRHLFSQSLKLRSSKPASPTQQIQGQEELYEIVFGQEELYEIVLTKNKKYGSLMTIDFRSEVGIISATVQPDLKICLSYCNEMK